MSEPSVLSIPARTRVRFRVPLGAIRGGELATMPVGTVGIMCGPWPHPKDDQQPHPDGYLLVVVDDPAGAWHVPVLPSMVEEVAL